MGGNRSKVPFSEPGNPLPECGIPQLDEIFEVAREPIGQLSQWRLELDSKTTNFIKSLHAQRIWEVNGDMEEVIYMFLTVFSYISAGDLSSIGLSYSLNSPYIKVDSDNLPYKAREPAQTYFELIDYFTKGTAELDELYQQLKGIDANSLVPQVSALTFQLKFSLADQLAALEIVRTNAKKLKQAPKIAKQLRKTVKLAEQSIIRAVSKATEPPMREVIAARGLQAATAKVGSVKTVMRLFWPVRAKND